MKKVDRKIDDARVLVFDLDGTLVRTNYANYLSYRKAIKIVLGSDLNYLYNPNDRFTRKDLEIIFTKLSRRSYNKIIEIKNQIYIDFLHETSLNNDVVEILYKHLHSKKIVLVTNSYKERANMVLKHHGISDFFDKKYFKIEGKNKYELLIIDSNFSLESMFIFENEKLEIENAINLGVPVDNVIYIE